MLEFDAILCGHHFQMPVLEENGSYRSMFGKHEIKLSKAEGRRT